MKKNIFTFIILKGNSFFSFLSGIVVSIACSGLYELVSYKDDCYSVYYYVFYIIAIVLLFIASLLLWMMSLDVEKVKIKYDEYCHLNPNKIVREDSIMSRIDDAIVEAVTSDNFLKQEVKNEDIKSYSNRTKIIKEYKIKIFIYVLVVILLFCFSLISLFIGGFYA